MSLELKFHFDEAAVARLQAVKSRVGPALLQSMKDAVNIVRRRVMTEKLQGQVLARRTGTLLRSIQQGGGAEQLGEYGARGWVGTNVWYGKMWELEGMKAHEVVATNAKALRFFWNPYGITSSAGAVSFLSFYKSVQIPAQPPRPFLGPALHESKAEIQRVIVARLGRALKPAAA